MIKQRLNDDVKAAMLAGKSDLVECLRSLKSAILYAEVASGKRDEGLGDEEILKLFAKESKKRQESADLYRKGGSEERAQKEEAEKQIIDSYLPDQVSEEDIVMAVEKTIDLLGASGVKDMGQVIGKVKAHFGASADGGLIAKVTKEKLEQ